MNFYKIIFSLNFFSDIIIIFISREKTSKTSITHKHWIILWNMINCKNLVENCEWSQPNKEVANIIFHDFKETENRDPTQLIAVYYQISQIRGKYNTITDRKTVKEREMVVSNLFTKKKKRNFSRFLLHSNHCKMFFDLIKVIKEIFNFITEKKDIEITNKNYWCQPL